MKILTIALVLAAASAFAEDRNWPGGTGTSDEPLDINAGDNWEGTAVTESDNLFFAADDYTYLTNTHDSATLTCNVIYFNSGDFSFSGDLKTRAVRNGAKDNAADNKNVSVLKKSGNWTLTNDFYSRYGTYPAEYSSVVFTNESGNVSASLASYVCAHPNSYMKVVNLDGNMTFANTLTLASTSTSTGVVEVAGGSLSVGSALYVGGSGTGMLTVSGGTVEVDPSSLIYPGYGSGSSGTIDLNGGVLKTKRIAHYKGKGYVNFNGGTLQANDDSPIDFIKSGLTVTVGECGGTIDNGGYEIKIPATLGGTGGLTFRGAGVTTLSGTVSYSGATRVAPGTTLSVSKSIASSILSNGLVLSGVLDVGASYTVLSCDEDLSDLSLDNVTCPAATGCTVTLGGDGKSIVVTPTGAIRQGFWTGIKNNNMSDAGNWADGAVPAAGADIDLSGASAATAINADLGCAFGAVTMGEGVVTFTGSLTASSFSDTSKVAVGANSTVTLDGDLEFSYSENTYQYVCYHVGDGGTFAVKGDIVALADQASYLDPCVESVNTGVISANGLVNNAKNNDRFRLVRGGVAGCRANWRIGENGLSGAKRFVVPNFGGATACITADADFTISANIVQYRNLIIDPAGRQVTIGNGSSDANTGGGILGGKEYGLTTVTGSGSVVANYDVETLTTTVANRVNAFAVEGSATLVLASGAKLSTSGAIALGDGATLAFRNEGRELALPAPVVLPETGSATLRIDGARLNSGDHTVMSDVAQDAADHLAIDAESEALDGRKTSLRVEDGNLVLNVVSKGLMIIIR